MPFKNEVTSSTASFAFFAIFVVLGVCAKDQRKQRDRISTGSSELTRTRTVKPPFPESVIRLLETTKLAYLATATDSENPGALQPHLSLMNFTYYKEGQQVRVRVGARSEVDTCIRFHF